jgi:hypothetical protein
MRSPGWNGLHPIHPLHQGLVAQKLVPWLCVCSSLEALVTRLDIARPQGKSSHMIQRRNTNSKATRWFTRGYTKLYFICTAHIHILRIRRCSRSCTSMYHMMHTCTALLYIGDARHACGYVWKNESYGSSQSLRSAAKCSTKTENWWVRQKIAKTSPKRRLFEFLLSQGRALPVAEFGERWLFGCRSFKATSSKRSQM